jgi:hypothetical protein
VITGKLVAFGAQPGHDALGIDERFRTTKRDEGDARRAVHERFEQVDSVAAKRDMSMSPAGYYSRNAAWIHQTCRIRPGRSRVATKKPA